MFSNVDNFPKITIYQIELFLASTSSPIYTLICTMTIYLYTKTIISYYIKLYRRFPLKIHCVTISFGEWPFDRNVVIYKCMYVRTYLQHKYTIVFEKWKIIKDIIRKR